jgi:hypothetical protein
MATFARFLDLNVDLVVDEFETFARTSGPAAEHLSSADLRDHAKLMLQAIAADMATCQSLSAQHEKAEGFTARLSLA